MISKEQKLKTRMYMFICQWISKVYKRGYILDRSSYSYTSVATGMVTTKVPIKFKEYKFHTRDIYSFFSVISSEILTNTLGTAEELVIDELMYFIKKIFYLNDKEGAEILAEFFNNKVYNIMLELTLLEQILYYSSNDYEL